MNQINPNQAIAEHRAIAEKLTCVVCLMMVTKPFHKCPQCSKNHCMNCEASVHQKSKCGICNSQTNLHQHDDFLVELKFHCRKEHCKKVFDFNSILQHQLTCVLKCNYCKRVLEQDHRCIEKLEKQQKDSDLLILKMLSFRAQGTYLCGEEQIELKILDPSQYQVSQQGAIVDCQVKLDVEKGTVSLDLKDGKLAEFDLNQAENFSFTLKQATELDKVFEQQKQHPQSN